jgi:cell division protein ZapB
MAENKVAIELSVLSSRLDDLLRAHTQLREENARLRAAHEQLAGERAQLLAKNEQARTRVEAMISRLKAMEQAG